MMKLEENLAKKDLSVFKTQPLELLVKQIYKYQKFKTSVILQKINLMTYKPNTAKVYIEAVKSYLHDGFKSKKIGSRLYSLVDKYKDSHVGILTPSEEDRTRPRVTQHNKSKTPTPSITVHPHAKKMIKEIQQINYPQYGVKYENTIKIFDSKEFCLGYKECFEVFNKDKKAELVTVRYELVEDNKNGVENGTN